MDKNFNILITSPSKKIPLIMAVRQSLANLKLKGEIHGGDNNVYSISKYFVDKFWLKPSENVLTIDDVLEYSKKNKIKAIIPTRDGELGFFSKHKETLSKNGISCMISNEKAIAICLDKLLFHQFLSSHQLPVITTSSTLELISSPSYVVKERFGAGSHSIGLQLDVEQAETWSKHLRYPIFQPFIRGTEYSIDVYINHQHSPHGAIVRARELIVNGESQVTTSIPHEKMGTLCLNAAILLGIYGHALFQVIRDSKNSLHIIECNPRFGGASTLSVAMGLSSFEWFIQESLKLPLPAFKRSPHEMRQVRYPADKVFPL